MYCAVFYVAPSSSSQHYTIALLDLSSAFDAVDHLVVLAMLQNHFGVSGSALGWFSSYLADRAQTIHVSGQSSSITTLRCGVPRGSVLCREMFIPTSTEDTDDSCARHALQHHGIADDTQMYVSAPPSQVQSISRGCSTLSVMLPAGVGHVTAVKCHENRTDVVGSLSSLHSLTQSNRTVVVGTDVLQPVESVRNLGVYLDSMLSMQTGVAKVTQTCFFEIQHLHGRDITTNVMAALVLT